MLGHQVIDRDPVLGLVGFHLLADRLDRRFSGRGVEAELLGAEAVDDPLDLGRVGHRHPLGIGA